MRTTWHLSGDSSQVLDLLHRRLAEADEVTDIERSAGLLVVRSRDIPTWAYLMSVLLPEWAWFKRFALRARTDRVLRITATGEGEASALHLEGDANASVSKVLVVTSHELFPDKVAAWDDE